MAKKPENRIINVCVVGLSGTEKEKGVEGIGKSCFCNRFVRPLADEYSTDHISVLSQNDFGGRVINNDHFLYWGEVTKTSDEGLDFTFNLIEQTEFIDDSSFQPFRSGKTDPYYKRCAAIKIQSAEKLMYICKNQLGLEHDFEQKYLADGRLTVHGFLCLFDVSSVHERSFEYQLEATSHILQSLQKTKKPIVLVTTKNDKVNDGYVREIEKLVNKQKGNIPIVESSAHHNINVELAFLTLAHLIDRTKGRPKITSYTEASKSRIEVLDVATEAYRNLVQSQVTDYKALWIPTHRRLGNHPDYNHYVDLFGTGQAQRLFVKHVRQLKDDFVQQKLQMHLSALRRILLEVLSDLTVIADRSWPNITRWFTRQDYFDTYFRQVPEGSAWHDPEQLESDNPRIPYDVLETNEAENCYRNHVTTLRQQHRRQELRQQFKQLLEENHNVCPGKSLNEVAIFFLGRECFSSLPEDDKQQVYEEHQAGLLKRVTNDFLELLLENSDLFCKFDSHTSMSPEDFGIITDRLAGDPRYKALNRLEEERHVILLQHLGFIQRPSKELCPYQETCMEVIIQALLETKAHRPQSWSRNSEFLLDSEDNRLNLVILGSDGLSDQLAQEIRVLCVDDEYTLDGQIYSLDYRTIEGDVSLPHNSFKTQDFIPNGCFCVYNSLNGLAYIQESLEKTLLSDVCEDRLPFQGLPVGIVLAHDPSHTEKDLMQLRDGGQSLADRLQCPFIDIPSSMMEKTKNKFHQDQIGLAIHSLVQCIKYRSTSFTDWHMAETIEPDIRILMCFMCGDPFNVELPLSPLLNHQCCYVTSDEYPTITLETYLDTSKRRVEVTLLSYHAATLVQEDILFNGYILVYSAKRRASLSTLRTFLQNGVGIPIKILAVTESGSANAFFSNECSQSLITEGNALADRLPASFMTTCSNFQQQTASYTPFFKECWDALSYSGEDSSPAFADFTVAEKMSRRPPAALPKPLPPRFDSFGHPTNKSSTSNSQSTDSEPVYDQLNLDPRCHSDSEGERVSSGSPVCGDSPYNTQGEEQVYSEIAPPDTDQLIKPSHVKNRRSMYAERYRKSFPSASSSFASSSYREDSTDTDSSLRSPKLGHHDRSEAGEPHYQFRKSNSMKLALKEGMTGWSVNTAIERMGKKLVKSSTLPSSATHPGAMSAAPDSASAGWYDDHVYDATVPLLSQEENPAYESVPGGGSHAGKGLPPPPTLPKPSSKPARPRPLDSSKFAGVKNVLNRNIVHSAKQHSIPPHLLVKAPLATPEHIEIGQEYATVRDAVPLVENDYARVHDALPFGKIHRVRTQNRKPEKVGGASDSDSECSSETKKEDIYARVNRRPTPHKKRHKPRYSDGSLPPPPPIPPYTEDRHLLVQQDQLEKARSQSPSEGSDGTGDETAGQKKQHTKKRRSFRSKKKQTESDSALIISPPWSDCDLSHSSAGKGGEEESYDGGASKFGDEDSDLVDSGYWKRKLRLKSDTEKQKRKEEKKAKEDEKKKMKEEEKRLKAMSKKSKKKDGRPLGPQSQSSIGFLEDMVQSDENLVPCFVEKCVTFIETEGLSAEGLYRVPGNRAHVDTLIERFKEEQQNLDILSLDIPVNAVATALKGFFADLAEPLIPLNLRDDLIEAAYVRDRGERLVALRTQLKRIPQCNWDVLKYLVRHLGKVAERSAENSMDSKNLAICFWPTLLRPEFTSFEKMAMVSKQLEEIIVCLLDEPDFFFGSQNET